MRKYNVLLKYIDTFIYDFDEEKIVFDHSVDGASRGIVWYRRFLTANKLEERSMEKWHFDIALDFLRMMKKESPETFANIEKYEFDHAHFSGGLYIRNRYIYRAKKHFCWMADHESGAVLSVAETIVTPLYDHYNKELCKIYASWDFKDIKEKYYNKYPFIEDLIKRFLAKDNTMTPEEVLEKMKAGLRERLGRDFFQNKLILAVQTIGKKNIFPDNKIKFINEVYGAVPPFEREYKYIDTLMKDGFLERLITDEESGVCTSIKECRAYLQNKFEIEYDEAMFLAECLWSAFKLN